MKTNLNLIFFAVEEKISKTLDNIIEVKGKVKSEISVLRDKLTLAKETIGLFKTELAKVQPATPGTPQITL